MSISDISLGMDCDKKEVQQIIDCPNQDIIDKAGFVVSYSIDKSITRFIVDGIDATSQIQAWG